MQLISAGICKDLITTNTRSLLPGNIFGQLNQTRAEFTLILLQRLVELGCRQPEVLRLLAIVWDCIRSLGYTFEVVLSSGSLPNDSAESNDQPFGVLSFDDVTYYRILLRLLFLALCAHTGNDGFFEEHQRAQTPSQASLEAEARTKPSPTSVSIILEIIDQVIALGFRQLVVAIHERSPQTVPDDIALLTALLQTCLRAVGINSHHIIMGFFERYDTARVATTLFSWSDKFAIDGDPVYGELSMLFLLEVSSMPAMAEQLAIAGVLGHISSASIATHIRRPNVSPFADGVGPQRCYSIWVRGILPLLLNMLTAVGASIAREVALFLLQFPHLLSQSATALDASLSASRSSAALESTSSTPGRATYPARITYGMVAELHSLALLTHILSALRDSLTGIDDIPEVSWDAVGVVESAEQLLSTRLVLRQRILPIGARELEWARQKPLGSRERTCTTNGECENRLEEKIVEELRGIREVLGSGTD
jgi:nuclear pore complex protein Nup188